MNFYDIPEDARLTTEQLQQYEVRCGGKLIPLALCEEESALVHMEKKFPREDYWIYLPGTQGADIRSLTLGGHQLQRSIEEPHWHVGKNLLHIDFTQPGQWVETLSIREHNPNTAEPGLHFIYRRYMATDEPDAEKTGESEMITNRLTQDGEVVGVRGYREKLYIPRIVDGKTVTRVALPGWSRSKYLRELVIEEDIELVDFDFHCETLEEIRIPESVQLAGPPVGILDTAWYRGQDEGDVYFCGYYCGTKGPTTRSVLRIREGTIGILDDAYGGDYLRQVILPESVAYIGKNAFAENKELMRILIPESAKDLSPALGIDGCRVPVFPGASSVVHPARKDFNGLTGWDLYALGRTGEAAKAVIPACYEPLAPKLTYDDGWIAHYYYSMEGQYQADCLLSLRIPTGAVVHNARFAPLTDRTSPLWSKNRRPAHYHWAADYLAHCAELISKGEPTVEQLRRLEEKWIRTHPDRLRNSLYYLEKEQKGITGIPPRVPSPEVFRLQAHIRKKWKKIQFGKDGVSIDG